MWTTTRLVKKGDCLVEIDPADFQVALAQAKANLAKDKATQIDKQTQDEKRAQDLFGKGAISHAGSRYQHCKTRRRAKADVQADKAAVEQAELNLSYTKILAPDDGRVTKKAVEPGNYVQVGQDCICARNARVLDDGEFQGNAIAQYAAGTAGDNFSVMPIRATSCADMWIVFKPAAERRSVCCRRKMPPATM